MSPAQRIAMDEEEAGDLSIHVKMCRMRYEAQMEQQAAIIALIESKSAEATAWRARVEKAVWAIVVMVAGWVGTGVTQVLPTIRALAGQ